MNYPLGTGIDFKGVYDRISKEIHLFEKTTGGQYIAPVSIHDLSDPMLKISLAAAATSRLIEEIEMLDTAGEHFDSQAVLNQEALTPVFFGSAMNNFGVQLLLDGFLNYAVPPAARISSKGIIKPEDDVFSGFVFKIQANMDPKHRDRIAFLEYVREHFTRDMQAIHVNSGKKIRLSNSQKLFGQERETVDEAYPGDIIGFVGNSNFGIGDTITEDPAIVYKEIPKFAPEHFVFMHNPNPSNYKKFRDGLDQASTGRRNTSILLEKCGTKSSRCLGAVGPLAV